MIVACIYCQTVCYVPTVEILKGIRERKLEEVEQYNVDKKKRKKKTNQLPCYIQNNWGKKSFAHYFAERNLISCAPQKSNKKLINKKQKNDFMPGNVANIYMPRKCVNSQDNWSIAMIKNAEETWYGKINSCKIIGNKRRKCLLL